MTTSFVAISSNSLRAASTFPARERATMSRFAWYTSRVEEKRAASTKKEWRWRQKVGTRLVSMECVQVTLPSSVNS